MSGRSRWPQGPRDMSAAAHLLRLRVRIPPGAWMSVSCECCVLSRIDLCEGPIPRLEESTKRVRHRTWSDETITLYTYNKQVEDVRVRKREGFIFSSLYNYTFVYCSVSVSRMSQFKLRLNLDLNIDLLNDEMRRFRAATSYTILLGMWPKQTFAGGRRMCFCFLGWSELSVEETVLQNVM